MLKRTISYIDFDGEPVTKDLYFHLSKLDVLTASDEVFNKIVEQGKHLESRIELVEAAQARIEAVKDTEGESNFSDDEILLADSIRVLGKMLVQIIDLSYGVRNNDQFIKNQRVLEEFKRSKAYEAFVEELLSDPAVMEEFIKSLLPK